MVIFDKRVLSVFEHFLLDHGKREAILPISHIILH